MHMLTIYALFLLKTATIVLAFIIIAVTIVALASRGKSKSKGKIVTHKLNRKFEAMKRAFNDIALSDKALKNLNKQSKKIEKKSVKSDDTKKRLFVLNFNGDIKASQVDALRQEITTVLLVATPKDEVVVCLESPGGVVHGYGLAASQLQRIRNQKIPLTVIVDKVAASGGYMMACVADQIIAAPFAIIGSIGVVMQLPNFNRLLDKNNIEFEQLTAGEYKRTLTMFGKNTDKAREKVLEELEEVQVLFKNFISQHRPQVDINQVATGEHWFATKAIEYHLVDALQTSDDYLLKKSVDHDLYEITYKTKPTLAQKFGKGVHSLVDGFMTRLWSERYFRT